MIICENISKTYIKKGFIAKKYKQALNNVSFQVKKNEIFSIIGLNGAGKSTLLSIILGIIKPSTGNIKFQIPDFKQQIGYMPETVNFPSNLTPFNILSSMKNIFNNIDENKITDTLKLAEIESVKKSPLKTFSKGMQQRFNLVQAIIHEPEILILDEPLSGLDPLGRKLFFDIFYELKNRGTTILLSSHILTDVEKISDRVAILNKGSFIKILDKSYFEEKKLSDIFVEIVRNKNE